VVHGDQLCKGYLKLSSVYFRQLTWGQGRSHTHCLLNHHATGHLVFVFSTEGVMMCYATSNPKLHGAIQDKRHGMLTLGVVLLNDNVLLHRAGHTKAMLEYSNKELFDHLPYSPDLAHSDCHLFTYLENWLQLQCSRILRSWWKVPKCGWVHWWQTSLVQAYNNASLNTISVSTLAVAMLRSSINIYTYFVYILIFSNC
jgi:hypothetical protein